MPIQPGTPQPYQEPPNQGSRPPSQAFGVAGGPAPFPSVSQAPFGQEPVTTRPQLNQAPFVAPQPQPAAPPPKGKGISLMRLSIWVIILVVLAGAGYLAYVLMTGQIKLQADKPSLESISIAGADLELGAGDTAILDGGATGVESALLNSFVIDEGAQLMIYSRVSIRAKTIKILGKVVAEGLNGKPGEEDRGGSGGAGGSGGGGGGVGASSDNYDAAASGGLGGGMSSDVRFGEAGQDGLSKARGVPGTGGSGSKYVLVQSAGKGLGGDSFSAALTQTSTASQRAFKKQGRGGDGATLSGVGAGGQGGAGGTKMRVKTDSEIKNYVLGGGGGGGGGHSVKFAAEKELIIKGKISADGGKGGDGMFIHDANGKEIVSSGAGGGGGGGSVVLQIESGGALTIEGEISADGGDGGQYKIEKNQKMLGNGGGGGTILIITDSDFKIDESKIHARGGAGGFVKGQNGQVSVASKLPSSAAQPEISLTTNAFSRDGNTGEVELAWTKPQTAEGAVLKGKIVRRLATDPTGTETIVVDDKKIDFSKIGNYIDSNLALGVTAYYRIVLHYELAGGIALPEFSSKVVGVTPEKNLAKMSAPQHSSIINYGRMAKDGVVVSPNLQSPVLVDGTVKIMWEPVSWSGIENIQGYVIYRSVAEDRFAKNTFSYAEPDLAKSLALKITAETIGVVGYVKVGNEFVDSNVASDKTYFYRVAAVSGTGGNYLVPTLSGYSNVQSITLKSGVVKSPTVTQTPTFTRTPTRTPTGATATSTAVTAATTAVPTETFTSTFTPTLTQTP
jgi:hypothetical protein